MHGQGKVFVSNLTQAVKYTSEMQPSPKPVYAATENYFLSTFIAIAEDKSYGNILQRSAGKSTCVCGSRGGGGGSVSNTLVTASGSRSHIKTRQHQASAQNHGRRRNHPPRPTRKHTHTRMENTHKHHAFTFLHVYADSHQMTLAE